MLAEFRDCLEGGREPKMTGEDGLKDLAVVLAAYRSARTGQPVPLDDLRSLDPGTDGYTLPVRGA
jgi:predicted dehydrogenase